MTAPLLTADEVAARLRVPRTWVYRAARKGTLPSVRCGRYRRFDERDVDSWIGEQRSAQPDGHEQNGSRSGDL